MSKVDNTKTVFIGDIHGKDTWKQIVDKESDAQRVVFIGDYFDSHTIPGLLQMHNFKEIIEYKNSVGVEVVLLIGNHDHHYYPEINNTETSGFQARLRPAIASLIDEHREHLQIAYSFENILCTHAGVSEVFLKETFGEEWNAMDIVERLNELFLYKPYKFSFTGWDPYGDSVTQTPIWIRPRSLLKASTNIRKQYRQVVGHTRMKKLDIEELKKWTGGNYFFIDTLETTGQYLIHDKGIFTAGQVQL